MKLPGERSPVQVAAAAVGDARPPKAAAVAPAFSKVPTIARAATTGENVAPITTLTEAVAQPRALVAAIATSTAARGDDDLMSQRL